VAGCLPRTCEAQSSNPRTTKKFLKFTQISDGDSNVAYQSLKKKQQEEANSKIVIINARET
jgi:hypothetical protein